MMKKIVLCMFAVIMLFSAVSFADSFTTKLSSELKEWDWSLGGMAYLRKASNYYYSVGAKRDLGPFFNWLDNERLYFELGYLNSHVVGSNKTHPDLKDFGYAGISTNANYLAECGLKGINTVLNSNFTTPDIMQKVLTLVGVVGAKRMDSTFTDISTGYDYGVNVAIIKQW